MSSTSIIWWSCLLLKEMFTHNNLDVFTTFEEMKAFLGVNFIIGINELPSIFHYLDLNNTIENARIQKVFTCNCLKNILQNLHFANREPITIH